MEGHRTETIPIIYWASSVKGILSTDCYTHFLCLSISTSIMLTQDTELRHSMIDYARKLMRFYVANCERLYGAEFVVYNVHSLLHIADDVDYFECSLDNVSAFPYENYLQSLKRLIRGSTNPIVQVSKRIIEYQFVHSDPFLVSPAVSNMKLSCAGRDSIVFLKSGRFAEICEVNGNTLLCSIYRRHLLQPFYLEPCTSDTVNIFFISKHSRRGIPTAGINRLDIRCKGLCLPYGDGYVLLPLLHLEATVT